MMKLNALPIARATSRPWEPPSSWPARRNRPIRPAMSTNVLTLFIRSSNGDIRVARGGLNKKSETPSAPPAPLRRRAMDEGLALDRAAAPPRDPCWTVPAVADSLDDPGVRLAADELLPFLRWNLAGPPGAGQRAAPLAPTGSRPGGSPRSGYG